MAKIGIEIKNYKKIKDLQVELKDYDVIIVNGRNRAGKSSLINGIFENLTAKNLSDEPLTRGEEKGEKAVIIEDKNGEEIKIVHTFTKKSPKGTFYAVKGKKKINSINEIRELIGETNNHTIDEFFTMCKTVPGRRKFIKEILMRVIDKKNIEEIELIDSLINSKDGEYYTKRAELNSELKALQAIPGITDEQKKLLAEKDDLVKEIDKLNKQSEDNSNKIEILTKIHSNIISIENGAGWQTLTENDLIFKDPDVNDLFRTIIKSEKEAMKYKSTCEYGIKSFSNDNEKIRDKSTAMSMKLAEIEKIEYSMNANGNIEEKIKAKEKEIDEINDKFSKALDKKDKILASSELPEGLKIIDESNFTYNGFSFNESEISESEGWLLLAQLTIPVYDSKYFRMGNAAIYGKEALDTLIEIAAKYGKVLALEKVNDDIDDVYVEGIVIDEENEVAIEKTDKKNEKRKQEVIDNANKGIGDRMKEEREKFKKEAEEEGLSTGDKIIKDAAKNRIKNGNPFPGDEKLVKDNSTNDDPLAVSFDSEKENYDEGKPVESPVPEKEEPIESTDSKSAEDITDNDINKLNLF